MRDKVIEWLKGGADAHDGVNLMEQAGASSLTLRLLRSNPSVHKKMMISFLCRKFGIQENFSVAWNSHEVVFKKKENPFRQEFQFLGQPGCPVELEALASRKISKYQDYVRLHNSLRNCTSLTECADVSRELIESYMENRMIWNELNYYKEHRTLLGKHSIYGEFRRRNELLRLPVKELVRRQIQVENNIWRVKSELSRKDKPHLDMIRRERLAGYEQELSDINRLLE